MKASPFAFLRGSAAVMAADLAATPSNGLMVQAAGDCHCLNFGGFATPERRLGFDINDFDETAVAPWEWDVKRLATSFVVATLEDFDKDARLELAETVARSLSRTMAVIAAVAGARDLVPGARTRQRARPPNRSASTRAAPQGRPRAEASGRC